jgi:hypothetical protein
MLGFSTRGLCVNVCVCVCEILMDCALYKLTHMYLCSNVCIRTCMYVCFFLNAINRAGWNVARCMNACMHVCMTCGIVITHTLSLSLSLSLTHTHVHVLARTVGLLDYEGMYDVRHGHTQTYTHTCIHTYLRAQLVTHSYTHTVGLLDRILWATQRARCA